MKKKILHILVKDKKAGAETVVQDILKQKKLNEDFEFKVLILSLFWKNQSQLFPEQTVSIFSALFKRWDLIHTHLFWGGLFGFIMRGFHPRTRWIHSLHYSSYEKLKWSFFKKIIDTYFIFNWADHLHGVSEECQKLVGKNKKIRLIPNYFEFNPRHQKKLKSEKLEILTVALFRPEKGFDRILSTAQILKKNGIAFNWTLCGDGPLFESFKNQLKNENLENELTILGFQKDLDLQYSQADLYVQPSYSESFGLSTYQAFQYRLPVIASAVGNLTKALREGLFGTLIASDSEFEQNLANSILSFNQNRTSFVKKADQAFDYYLENSSSNNFAQEWSHFYKLQAIVFLSPITTQATGGIQKQLLLQTRDMVQSGFEVIIIQKKDFQLDDVTLSKWSHCQFYNCFYLNKGLHLPLVQRLNGVLFIFNGLFNILKIRHIKAIHALQMYSPTLLAVLAKQLIGCRVVVKVTASGSLGEVSQLKKLPFKTLRMKAFKKVDYFLALTEPMKQELIDYGIDPSHIQVVPNSVEFYQAREMRTLQSQESFNILYTGRISIEKSLETLIEASLLLARQFPSQKIKVLIVGEVYKPRNNFEELAQKALEAPSNLNISFEGFQKNTQSYYQQAHVFCLTSSSEGMSNALLEAMSHGLPCIVSDIPANTSLVHNENTGLTFKVTDPKDLFKQLSRILIDQSENNCLLSHRLSKASHQFINNHFSVQAVCEKIKEAYSN